MTQPAVATFNVGSSSLKFSLFAVAANGKLGDCLLRGAIRDLHGERSIDLTPDHRARELSKAINGATSAIDLMQRLAPWLAGWREDLQLVGVGHRIVHGGKLYGGPAISHHDVLEKLDALSVFAPAHQPHNLAGVRALSEALPEAVQTLSFDTAFHRTMPRLAELYALPRVLSEEGVLRFGFHGLSYAHIAETLPALLGELPKRVLALHLGSGASACAMVDGKSVATSMGLTALDGLPMATRCGDLDPGVVLHLIKDRGMAPDAVADMLYTQSGLLGVSGLSGDTRILLQSDAPEAEEAIDLYCYRIARAAGSLAVAMGGLDGVAFSGGVGENAPEIRARILKHLEWLGPQLDPDANANNEAILSPQDAAIPIVRIVADEERIIARDCASLL
ncbi:MAG: acetate/propionate family kinase [Pseudomonadota bacterium]